MPLTKPRFLSIRIMIGPKTKHMNREVTVAYAVLKVMYRNMLKADTYSLRGYRR